MRDLDLERVESLNADAIGRKCSQKIPIRNGWYCWK